MPTKPVTRSIEITFNFWMLGAEKTVEHRDKRPSQPVIVRGDQSAIQSIGPSSFNNGRFYLFAE
jgi:hypothetical protein